MNNIIGKIFCVMFFTFSSALADSAEKGPRLAGTWRTKEKSLQLDDNHNFLLNYQDSIHGYMSLRGEWKLEGSRISLSTHQVKLESGEVKDVRLDDVFPNITISIIDKVGGRRVLRFDEKEYHYVSSDANVPEPWEDSPPPELDVKSGWFIRPPVYPLPQLDLQINLDDLEKPELTFKKNNAITGISGLAIWEKGANTYLWRIKMNGMSLDRLTYGDLPSNSLGQLAKQLSPELPLKPLLPSRENILFVRIDVDYETLFPPSRGSDPMFFAFEYGKDGKIRRINDIDPAAVKEPECNRSR